MLHDLSKRGCSSKEGNGSVLRRGEKPEADAESGVTELREISWRWTYALLRAPLLPSCFSVVMSATSAVPSSSTNSVPAKPRQKRHQVPRACAHCAMKHSSCSESRPCTRCVKHGLECVERPRKRRRPASTSCSSQPVLSALFSR